MKVLLALTLVLVLSFCAAAELPEAVFILDASGSMQEPAGSQTKIIAAQSVLAQVIPSIDPEVKVGLAAYGHRRSQDCTDIEILVPPGSDDRPAILARVQAMQPKGMTPISEAILQVAESLPKTEAETTIVLVSDGKETCGGDPCAVVRQLKARGIRFVMHVVGFDVSDEEKEQLACIAEAGGGRYFGAADADALLAALQSVNEELSQKVEAAKTQIVKQATGLGKLHVTFPESASQALAGFRIVRRISDKPVKEGEFPSADSTHPLMSGEYSLTLLFANPNYQPLSEMAVGEFTVAKGETTEIAFGALVFNLAPELENDATVEAVVIREHGTGRECLRSDYHGNGYYLFKPKALPAGTYDVALVFRRSETPAVVASGLDVAAGQDTVLTLDSGFSVVRPEGTKLTAWQLRPAGEATPLLDIQRGWDNEEPLWRLFPVPPGTYDLQVRVEGMEEWLPAGESLVIQPGQTLQFDTGM